MTLHVFNPEHDLALASGLANFTSPKAGRELRHDLERLPEWWAEEGDIIYESGKCRKENGKSWLMQIDHVEPWGWDAAIRAELLRAGVRPEVMPTEEQIERIRELSNRATAVALLKQLRTIDGTTGESCVCNDIDEVFAYLNIHKDIVVKAPWSSSGRGVRFVNLNVNVNVNLNENDRKWIENIIRKQGSIIAEQRCDKVQDFAMEFAIDHTGRVTYEGLSLFDTTNTAYTGNLLLPEEEKKTRLTQYVHEDTLNEVRKKIMSFLSEQIAPSYQGPLGVDMMICANGLLNPCIEINLRRTMGHVALAMTRRGKRGTMAITYTDGKYKLTTKTIN